MVINICMWSYISNLTKPLPHMSRMSYNKTHIKLNQSVMKMCNSFFTKRTSNQHWSMMVAALIVFSLFLFDMNHDFVHSIKIPAIWQERVDKVSITLCMSRHYIYNTTTTFTYLQCCSLCTWLPLQSWRNSTDTYACSLATPILVVRVRSSLSSFALTPTSGSYLLNRRLAAPGFVRGSETFHGIKADCMLKEALQLY